MYHGALFVPTYPRRVRRPWFCLEQLEGEAKPGLVLEGARMSGGGRCPAERITAQEGTHVVTRVQSQARH